LFDYQLPLDSDLFFFGRDQIVADHLDAIRRSQNRGLFGLRKTGKTSILYKLKRQMEREGLGAFLYYDCKMPSIRMM
jgi:predicted AAA+ superfamily ATPase